MTKLQELQSQLVEIELEVIELDAAADRIIAEIEAELERLQEEGRRGFDELRHVTVLSTRH
jgi:hypothetical protein